MNSIKKPIVIVGGGFAGINAALNFKNKNPQIPIIVVDSNSQFIFKPLLYEVLSNEIKAWEIAPSFEDIFSEYGITFFQNHLISIDTDQNILHFKDHVKIYYEYLILCTGSSSNSFSIKGVDEFCYFFNTLDDQNKLKLFLDSAKCESSKKSIYVVGAGPSGIELANKIYDLYGDKFKVSVIEKTNQILSNSKSFNREEANKSIKQRGIDILLNTTIKEISKKHLIVTDINGKNLELNYEAVIWTAGVKPNLPIFTKDIEKFNGRILINSELRINSLKNVFALGDIAIIENNKSLPITAQVAMQQGKYLANNFYSIINNEKIVSFEFQDNGEMISLGLGEASISGFGLTLAGRFAFDLRRLVYASKMPMMKKSFMSAASWILDKKTFVRKFASIDKS